MCGVMLGMAALGNLLQSYSEMLRYICGIIAGFMLILVICKLVMFGSMVKEDLKNPIMASISATFPMALMLLSVYVKPWLGALSMYIWYFAIGLQLALVVYFTVKFIVKLQMPKVFASYFIVYAGIVVSAVSAPAYGKESLGTLAFWFGLIAVAAIFVIVTLRYIKFKEVPDAAKPLICIYTAPVSLCVAGYVQSVTPKAYGLLITLYAAASLLYVFALVKALGYLKLPFYPSCAAFTFPFVISAIASKQTMACLAKMQHAVPALQYVVTIQTVIAVAFVGYTFIRFMGFIFTPSTQAAVKK